MGNDALVLSELWDTERLAGYLGVNKHYVYRLTSEHRIGFVRVGKGLRFRPVDVAAWLDSQTVAPASTPTVARGSASASLVSRARRGRPRLRDRAA
ncbi:MAG: helix-turn-helix domain-containing protein [Acidimicrobiales bacterium]